MRRLALPAVLVAVSALSACSMGGLAMPTPTPSETTGPTPAPSATVIAGPTTVDPLPSGTFLQVSATAISGDSVLRVVLTVHDAVPLDDPDAEDAWAELQSSCPNAIDSQLEIHPGLQPVGVILSTVEAEGNWRGGPPFGVAPGGTLVSLADGSIAAPPSDPPGMFGCSATVLTGEGRATIASLVLGDPTEVDDALEAGLANGLYGLEIAEGTAVVTWRDCVVQLSNRAERLSADRGWVPPGEWGTGCLIGDPGEI